MVRTARDPVYRANSLNWIGGKNNDSSWNHLILAWADGQSRKSQ
jgi:hypothetical protein